MKDYKIGDKVWLKGTGCCFSHSRSGEHTITQVDADNRVYLLDDGYYHNDDCFASDEDIKPVQIVNDVPENFKPVQIVLNLNTPEELMYVWGAFNSSYSHICDMTYECTNYVPDPDMQLILFGVVDEAARENGLIIN